MRALLALLLLAATGAAAQEAPGGGISIKTFNVVSLFAAPPWTTTEHLAADTEVYRHEAPTEAGTTLFLVEFIPKGESFDAWTELYALTAETPLTGTARDYRDGMLARYDAACAGVSGEAVASTETAELFVLYCPAYVDDPETGEVAVMHYRMQDGTLVRNYYHRRGPAFSMSVPESMPIQPAEIGGLLQHVGALRLTPAKE